MKTRTLSFWQLAILWPTLLLTTGCTSVREVTFTTERIEKLGELEGFPKQSFQGMSIYGDYLVSLQNTGLATIYRLTDSGKVPPAPERSKERIHQFPLASNHKANHANVADFGIERVAKDDVLPVLYVSQCARERYEGTRAVTVIMRASIGEP